MMQSTFICLLVLGVVSLAWGYPRNYNHHFAPSFPYQTYSNVGHYRGSEVRAVPSLPGFSPFGSPSAVVGLGPNRVADQNAIDAAKFFRSRSSVNAIAQNNVDAAVNAQLNLFRAQTSGTAATQNRLTNLFQGNLAGRYIHFAWCLCLQMSMVM